MRESQIEDALQEVFLVVHTHLQRGTLPRNIQAWVGGIAFKVAAKLRKLRARDNARHDYEKDATTIPGPDDEDERRARALVLRLVEEIENDDQREVVIRFHRLEQSVDEIAAELDRPVGTVKTQLQAGRRAIQTALARHTAHEQQRLGGAFVLPLFGVPGMLDAIQDVKAPAGLRARLRERLLDLPELGGGGGSGGDGPAAPGMPPAAPVAPLARAAAAWAGTTGALVIVGALTLIQGIIIGALWDPLHGSHGTIEAKPDAVVVGVTSAPAPSAVPAPSVSTLPLPMLRDPRATQQARDSSNDLSVNAEQNLLDKARAAIKGGHFDRARAALNEHARRWGGGGILANAREDLRGRLDAADAQPLKAP